MYGLVWPLLLLYKSGEYSPNLLPWKTSDAAYVLSPINSELCRLVAANNSDEVVLYVLHNMASEWPPVAALAQLQNTPSSTTPSFSSLCPAPSPLLLIQNDRMSSLAPSASLYPSPPPCCLRINAQQKIQGPILKHPLSLEPTQHLGSLLKAGPNSALRLSAPPWQGPTIHL
jgi:hypothetical protein